MDRRTGGDLAGAAAGQIFEADQPLVFVRSVGCVDEQARLERKIGIRGVLGERRVANPEVSVFTLAERGRADVWQRPADLQQRSFRGIDRLGRAERRTVRPRWPAGEEPAIIRVASRPSLHVGGHADRNQAGSRGASAIDRVQLGIVRSARFGAVRLDAGRFVSAARTAAKRIPGIVVGVPRQQHAMHRAAIARVVDLHEQFGRDDRRSGRDLAWIVADQFCEPEQDLGLVGHPGVRPIHQ